MSTIFISYSRADSRIVDRIDSELERHGFDCWVDRSDIGAGAAWRAEIAQAIRDCDAFVLVFSPRAAGSANITKELALAENNGKPIFPLVLENHPIPVSMEYQLAGIQQIQTTEKDFRNGMRQLIEALPQPEQGLSKPVAEKDIRLPKPPERKNGKHRRLIGLTVGFIGITAIVVIAINNMPLFTGGDYPVEPYTLGGETDYPDFQDKPVDGFRTDDITGEADDDIGFSNSIRPYEKQGVYLIDIPSNWSYTDMSTYDRTLNRFGDPSGQIYLDIEVGNFNFPIPDAVLGSYNSAWLANGFYYSEYDRWYADDGWIVTGILQNDAMQTVHEIALYMTTSGITNGTLLLYGSPHSSEAQRAWIAEYVFPTFILTSY